MAEVYEEKHARICIKANQIKYKPLVAYPDAMNYPGSRLPVDNF